MFGIRRRHFITLLGSAAAWPLAARAQQGERMRRVGVLMNAPDSDPSYRSYAAAFAQTLQRLGWHEGKNLHLDLRWSAGDPERIGAYAAELARMTPDLILASSSANLIALLRTTRTIPIVFVQVTDPVAQGFVSNLAHPGGNITGFTSWEPSIAGKWLDFLKQAVPDLTRVAVIFNPDTSPQSKLFVPFVKASASSFAVEVIVISVHAIADFEPPIANFSHHPNSGLILLPDQFTYAHRGLILELVARYRVPAIYAGSEAFARDGGLIYFGFDEQVQFRQAAIYADRILKGANPGELPIQQPTKFSLIINLRAARALGIEMPTSLLLSADEVIE
jgi:putative tryptophan/tyrosine transport system substrate-binding protein